MPRVPANPNMPKPPSRTAHACPECGKWFSRKEYVVRHQRLKHVDGQQEPHLCSTCRATFTTAVQLERHRTSAHAEPTARSCSRSPPLKSPVPVPVFHLPPVLGDRPSYTSNSPSCDRLPTIGSASALEFPDRYPAAGPLAHTEPQQPYLLPAVPTTTAPPHASASYSRPPTASQSSARQAPGPSAFQQSPESLSQYGFFNSALPPLAVQLLLDAAAFPPSILGSEPSGGIGAQYVGINGRVVGAGTRLVQGSEFHIRVIALLGTPADWGIGEEGEANAPGARGGDLIRSPRFFPRSQPFCVGYRDAWQIPPLPKLSRYASLATSFLLTQIPILHRPTMFNTEMTPQVAFALAVAGAGLETEGTEFHGNMVKEKRIFAIHHLHELELTELEMFSVLQSLSIYNYLGLYHEDPMQRTYSAASHAVLISTYRYHRLPDRIKEINWEPPLPSAPAQDVEQSWREWIRLETLTRITFMVYLLDLTMTNTFGATPALNPSELALVLPAAEALWSAPTSAAWAHLLTLPQFLERPPCFLKIVDSLLAQGSADLRLDPARDRERDDMLGRVTSLSAFSLAILRETLARLEIGLRAKGASGEEQQEDGRDSPEVALRKVLNGARVLELVSGSAGATGCWFKPVRPIFQ